MLYSPWLLLFLLLIPLVVFVKARGRMSAGLKFSNTAGLSRGASSWRKTFRPVLFVARLLCIVLLVIALVRPREGTAVLHRSTEGVAMEIVVDHSGSMAEQMRYGGEVLNRLEVVKKVAADFIKGDGKDLKGREGDLVGLITFAGYADTVCPLVSGHGVLVDFLEQTELVTLRSEDGTAIGDAIALAAARLKKAEEQVTADNKKMMDQSDEDIEPDFKIKSKVMILLTDGRNNAGEYDPVDAAKTAKEWGIKIYTIAIGSAGGSYRTLGGFSIPMSDPVDEKLLKSIAEYTGGFYGRAGDAETLREIYERIDELEKTEVKSVEYVDYAEKYRPWAIGGLWVLLFEIAAGCTVFRKIP